MPPAPTLMLPVALPEIRILPPDAFPAAMLVPAANTKALLAVLVVVMASVMVRLPVSVLMLTGPVALMFGGFTWANVKLPAFTKLRLPTFSAARVVTLLAAAVNETLPCMSARPVVVTTPLLF